MADSKRLKTLKRLCDYLLAEVQVTNGYKHDLAAVQRGRVMWDSEDPLPCVSILENLNPDRDYVPVGRDDDLQQRENWVLLVQGWVDDDEENPTDPAFELMADVKKALAKIYHPRYEETLPLVYNLGGLIHGIEVEPGTVRPPSELSAKAFFWMRVTLKFYEEVNDPYNYGPGFIPDPP